MRIAVIGGAGFIGSHVAEYYAQRGLDVSVLDNLSRSKTLGYHDNSELYNWRYLQKNYESQIRLELGDIRERSQLEKLCSEAEAIIHTAGQVAVSPSISDPMSDFLVNVLGTLNVLETARRADAAVVFTSTNKVYGENVNKIPLREGKRRYFCKEADFRLGVPETYPIDLTGHTPYGASKLAADIYVQEYARTYGLKAGVFRMSCIYGERQFGVEDQGWLAWFVKSVLEKRPIKIYGNGKQVRDILHVSDLVRAFDLFLKSRIAHDVFNIGGGPGKTLSLLELLGLIEQLTGIGPKLEFHSWRRADQRMFVSDIRKAEVRLNWKPTVLPRDGVQGLVNWMQDHPSDGFGVNAVSQVREGV